MPDVFIASSEGEPKPEEKDSPQIKNLHGSTFPLSALTIYPRRIHFQDQEKEEEVVLLVRKHWVTNLPWILVGGAMFLVPIFVSLFLPILVPDLQLPFNLYLAGGAFWYLISFGYLYINFLIWYFNAQLVTNKRIMDIDFHSLTYKEVSSTQLEQIQDVNFRVGGVIRHIFDFGDVFIQTAGTNPNFEFNDVPKPAFVADKLTDLMAIKRGKI